MRVLAPHPRAPVETAAAPPRFSIVITAYQAAATIGAALRSAFEQSTPAHEVVVVDDGSTDDLDGALEPFADRIRLVRKENGGGASARNAAAASGDFMAILDSDDVFHPRRLEALGSLAVARPDLDLLTTDSRFVVDGEPVGTFFGHNEFAVSDQRSAILRSCFVGGWPAVRLSRLREIGGFDETLRIAYDWDCWLRLILDGSQAGLAPEPYHDYVLHSGSLATDRVASLWERVRLLEKAAANPALLPAERPALKQSLRDHRRRAVLADIGTGEGGSAAGARIREVARSGGAGIRARAIAVLALVEPGLARRLVVQNDPPERRFGQRAG